MAGSHHLEFVGANLVGSGGISPPEDHQLSSYQAPSLEARPLTATDDVGGPGGI